MQNRRVSADQLSLMDNCLAMPTAVVDPFAESTTDMLAHGSDDRLQSFLVRPTLDVPELDLRSTDMQLDDASLPLRKLRNDWSIYQSLLGHAKHFGKIVSDEIYRVQIGYKLLTEYSACSERAIGRALSRLEPLKYVMRYPVAHGGTIAATYWVRSEISILAMFKRSGCTYYRVTRGNHILLFKPVCAARQPEAFDD